MGKRSQPKQKKPVTKRWWFWAIIVVFGLGVIGSIGGGGSDTPDASAPSSSAVSSEPEEPAAPDPEEEKALLKAAVEDSIPEKWKGDLYSVDVLTSTADGSPMLSIYLDADEFSDLDACTDAAKELTGTLTGLEGFTASSISYYFNADYQLVATADVDDPVNDPDGVEVVSLVEPDEPEAPSEPEQPSEPAEPAQPSDPQPEPDPDPVTEPEPEPEPDPEPEPEPQEPEENEQIVYITETGEKYHRGSCRYLKDSKIEISLSDAIAQGYTPCGVCKP